MNETTPHLDYTQGTGKRPRVIVLELDPENPIWAGTIVTEADEPGPIVILRQKPRSVEKTPQQEL